MPELPEVETIVRDLRPLLVGRRIVAVRRITALELRQPWNDSWASTLIGTTIRSVLRRGKWINLDLGGPILLVHLGMTGQFTVVSSLIDYPTHTHLVFDLDEGQQLRFRDIRRFGGVTLLPRAEDVETFFLTNGMGPEPFTLDPKAWRDSLSRTQRPIKAVLLDQAVVAGVGNIYADEALFVARIHPARPASELETAQADRLRKAIIQVLTTAIEHRGSTIRNYVGGSGLSGAYQDEFRVYGQTGQPCPKCSTPIARLRLAGRSTHYCPACQPPEVPVRRRAKKET